MRRFWGSASPTSDRKEFPLGRTTRLCLLLATSVIALAGFSAATASAAVVCVGNFNEADFFDANSPGITTCPNPPALSGADETNTLTISRTVADDPSTPGQQQVTAITFHD